MKTDFLSAASLLLFSAASAEASFHEKNLRASTRRVLQNQQTYYTPTYNGLKPGIPVDFCTGFNHNNDAEGCGQPAAELWCQYKNTATPKAISFEKTHVGSATWMMGDQAVNGKGNQDGFSVIVCGAEQNSPVKPPTGSIQDFNAPMWQDYPIDYCLHDENGHFTNCGQEAADKFCTLNQYSRATNFARAHIGSDTYLLGDNRVNNLGGQQTFHTISCIV